MTNISCPQWNFVETLPGFMAATIKRCGITKRNDINIISLICYEVDKTLIWPFN